MWTVHNWTKTDFISGQQSTQTILFIFLETKRNKIPNLYSNLKKSNKYLQNLVNLNWFPIPKARFWWWMMMDDEVVQRVFQEGGRDYIQKPATCSSSSSSSILQSLPLHVVYFVFLSILIFWLIFIGVCLFSEFGVLEFYSMCWVVYLCCIVMGYVGLSIPLFFW